MSAARAPLALQLHGVIEGVPSMISCALSLGRDKSLSLSLADEAGWSHLRAHCAYHYNNKLLFCSSCHTLIIIVDRP